MDSTFKDIGRSKEFHVAKREAPNKEDSIQTDVENMNGKVEHVTSDLLCMLSHLIMIVQL